MHRWRRRTFQLLHKPSAGDIWGARAGVALAILIVINAAAVAIETVPGIPPAWLRALARLEAVSTAIFLVEYIARVWTCVEQAHLARPVAGRLRYMLQPLALMDLIVVATAYFQPLDLRFLRILRLVRLLPVMGLHQLNAALHHIGHAVRLRAHLLIASAVLMAVAIYFSAALLFQVEHHAQPQVFTSIPATLWWAVVSLTTVGYGDMAPVTTLGKVSAAGMLVFGIGIFALPTAIFTAAIIDASAAASFAQQQHPGDKDGNIKHPPPR